MSARRRLAALIAASAAVAPGTALAHSTVIGTNPADGAVLTTAPTSATITFNEAIREEFAYAKLTGDGGAQTPKVAVKGAELVATFDEALPDGSYTLAYRIASDDTHPVSGAVRFQVKTGAGATNSAPATSSTSTSAAASATTSSAAPSSAATEAASDSSSGPSTTFWGLLTAAAVGVAMAGWAAGRRARSRRR